MIFAVEHGDYFEAELSNESLQKLADMAFSSGVKNLSLLSNHATRRQLIAFTDIQRRRADANHNLFIDDVQLRAERWVVDNTLVAREEIHVSR